jgi:hypothetical protein
MHAPATTHVTPYGPSHLMPDRGIADLVPAQVGA